LARRLVPARRRGMGEAAVLVILRLTETHGSDRRVLDAGRGVEIRLAGAEGDDVDAAGAQLTGAGLYGERRGRGKALQAIGEYRHRAPPPAQAGDLGGSFSARRFSTPAGTRLPTDAP